MSVYGKGHVKHNPDVLEVAVRTMFPEENPQLAGMAWLVATTNVGARYARTDEVESWPDLFVPGEGS